MLKIFSAIPVPTTTAKRFFFCSEGVALVSEELYPADSIIIPVFFSKDLGSGAYSNGLTDLIEIVFGASPATHVLSLIRITYIDIQI